MRHSPPYYWQYFSCFISLCLPDPSEVLTVMFLHSLTLTFLLSILSRGRMHWCTGQINGTPWHYTIPLFTLSQPLTPICHGKISFLTIWSPSTIFQNTHTCPFSTTSQSRSLRQGRTPVAPESLSLLLHHLNNEAKTMKNGLSRSHPSQLGMLSSDFIHFSDLLSIWSLVTK